MATLSGPRRALLLALGSAVLVIAVRTRGIGGPGGVDPVADVPGEMPRITVPPQVAPLPVDGGPDASPASAKPAAAKGTALLCPDGSTLPLLNGVPSAPPIERPAHCGPLPPVVGRVVDGAGDEWYQHADGSTTTTRWRTVIHEGVARRTVETLHNARLPAGAGRVRSLTADRGLAGSR